MNFNDEKINAIYMPKEKERWLLPFRVGFLILGTTNILG